MDNMWVRMDRIRLLWWVVRAILGARIRVRILLMVNSIMWSRIFRSLTRNISLLWIVRIIYSLRGLLVLLVRIIKIIIIVRIRKVFLLSRLSFSCRIIGSILSRVFKIIIIIWILMGMGGNLGLWGVRLIGGKVCIRIVIIIKIIIMVIIR